MPNMPTNLPENDRALVAAVKAGLDWSPMAKPPVPEQLADPVFVAKMPGVRASTIRALCLGLWDDVAADPWGVRVVGVRIDGQLNLSFGKGREPLLLAGCYFAEQFVLQEARLPALYLMGSHLAQGLSGDGLRVEGSLMCRSGFHSLGEVRLIGARIGSNADFTNATLNGGKGAALRADRMVVAGGVRCADGFHSFGEVRLLGARIGSNADFTDATLDGGTGVALKADGMVVTGALFCRDGFRLSGTADLTLTRIGALLDWRPKQWNGQLDLSHANAGQWCDGWGPSGWSSEGSPKVDLNHFTYGALFSGNEMNTDSTIRIKWLRAAQGKDFRPSPYQILARVLRAAGDDRGAAAVGLAKVRARARHRAKEYSWPVNWLYRLWMGMLDLAIGHGYRPWQGVIGMLILLLLGCALFGLNAPQPYGGPGTIKPADPVFIAQNHIKKPGEYETSAQEEKVLERGHRFGYTLPVEYTPFSAFWYSFDTLIPLIDLGQEKAWSPSPLVPSFTKDPIGWLLLFYLYFHIIAGWVLTTLTVVAMTGLIKRDKDEE